MVLLLWFQLAAAAQRTQLEIHQINVGNGDGALITLWDNDKLVYTIVIDGGLPSTENKFIPYLRHFIPEMPNHPGKREVNWVILSHNHKDHFSGLIELFRDTAFIIRAITDQGGYTIGNTYYNTPVPRAEDNNCDPCIAGTPNVPNKTLRTYVEAVAAANKRAVAFDQKPIVRYNAFDCAVKEFKKYSPGNIGGTPVTMECIAANGFTAGVMARTVGGRNANNFAFGWILQYGQFRFYTGGDLGGEKIGNYTDQETSMAAYLDLEFPNNHPETGNNTGTNFRGHVCVMKADHHGSTHSSNSTFLGKLACSSIVTSAGKHDSWKIPTVEFVDRVAAIPAFDEARGVYFTQILDYPKDKSLTEANKEFKGKSAYNYVEPGKSDTDQFSYVFIVKPNTEYPDPPKPPRMVDITKESIYAVFKVRTSNFEVLQQKGFLCHKP